MISLTINAAAEKIVRQELLGKGEVARTDVGQRRHHDCDQVAHLCE